MVDKSDCRKYQRTLVLAAVSEDEGIKAKLQ